MLMQKQLVSEDSESRLMTNPEGCSVMLLLLPVEEEFGVEELEGGGVRGGGVSGGGVRGGMYLSAQLHRSGAAG